MATPWGEIVRELMKEQGISQRAIAVKADVHRSTLRKFLVSNCIAVDLLEKLLLTLGYSLEHMSSGDTDA